MGARCNPTDESVRSSTVIHSIDEKGPGNGQIHWTESPQSQSQAADQEKAAAAKQAEKEGTEGGIGLHRMHDGARKAFNRMPLLLAIAFFVLLWSMILHKASGDIARLAQKHSGGDFWLAMAKYFLSNLAGG
jgi:hypothetical protein